MATNDVMNNAGDYVHCMLIPMQEHYLLLPNSTITEVIPKTQITRDTTLPANWLGYVDWQDHNLPIIDIESLIASDIDSAQSAANKLCIISGINPDARIEYYAVPCTGSPQLITLNSSALKLTENGTDSAYLHCQIQIGTKLAFIPNLDHLETQIDNITHS